MIRNKLIRPENLSEYPRFTIVEFDIVKKVPKSPFAADPINKFVKGINPVIVSSTPLHHPI